MTSPRSQLVDPTTPGYYHCMSRCVRRAWLCGVDACSGESFEHRRQWVEDRIVELGRSFALGVYAYAVMSNHLHVVVKLDPATAWAWLPEEVARRWVALCPVREAGEVDERATARRAEAIAGDPERVARYRERLASLSWFMRCLSEPIARRANREDGCTGRFWEGRFRCQALLDDAAVLACMSYVDLNPVRSGIARDLTDSQHTSVKQRLTQHVGEEPIAPVAGIAMNGPAISTRAYLALVDWTGRLVKPGKRGVIDAVRPPILAHLGLREREWQCQVLGIESRYWRAVGAVESLMAKAQAMGQCWLKGSGRHALARTFG